MIVSPAEIIAYLGGGSNWPANRRALITLLHPLVEQSIKSFLRSRIEQATYTHFLPITARQMEIDSPIQWEVVGSRAQAVREGYDRIQLPEGPVRSITSVYEDSGAHAGQAPGAFGGTALTSGQDYYLDVDETGISWSGLLYRVGSWPSVERSVKVTYVAGFTAAELNGDPTGTVQAGDIKLAVLEQMQYELARAAQTGPGPVQSESLGDYSVTYAQGVGVDLTYTVRRRLQKYVNYGRLY